MTAMRRFGSESLLDLRDWLVDALRDRPTGARVSFEVPDPDLGTGHYAGEPIDRPDVLPEATWRHRGYAVWVELAELLGCRLRTPRLVTEPERPRPEEEEGPEGEEGFVRLTFERIDETDSFHDDTLPPADKYGATSRFARIDKRELPSHALALEAAFQRIALPAGARVLALGVNSGDELALLERTVGAERFASFELVGIDHSASALEKARERFAAHPSLRLHCVDLNTGFDELSVEPADLLLSIGTLHSPGVRNEKALLMRLVQEQLSPRGAVLLGFPNCRHAGGEVFYGARMRNSPHPDLALVAKDIDFCQRYLQQHRFRVTLTGKHYLLLTATRFVRQTAHPART